MLSSREKKEMLSDGRSRRRRDDFRFARNSGGAPVTFEEYLKFLNDVQALFGPFKVSRRPTVTKNNKL